MGQFCRFGPRFRATSRCRTPRRIFSLPNCPSSRKPLKEKSAGGLGAERSAFLTKAKYDEIVDCLKQWEIFEDKKLRREKWSQGHAWVKKYKLFGDGDAAVLICRGDDAEAVPA